MPPRARPSRAAGGPDADLAEPQPGRRRSTVLVILVAAYVFYFVNQRISGVDDRLRLVLRRAPRPGRLRRRDGRAFWCDQHRHRGPDARRRLRRRSSPRPPRSRSWAGVVAGFSPGWQWARSSPGPRCRWQMDQIIAGVVINIIATGITPSTTSQGAVAARADAQHRHPRCCPRSRSSGRCSSSRRRHRTGHAGRRRGRALRPVPDPLGIADAVRSASTPRRPTRRAST